MKDLRSKSVTALTKEMEEALHHIKELRFKISSNQLKNVRDFRKTRTRVAQIQTLLREKRNESAKKV